MLIRVRYCEFDPAQQDIYQVLEEGNEVLDSAFQEAWDTEMLDQRDNGSNDGGFQVYIQYLPDPPEGFGANARTILTVEFPDIRCSYTFQSVQGVAQWFFLPLEGFDAKHDLPHGLRRVQHAFFETMLIPITTSTFNAIGALLRLRDSRRALSDTPGEQGFDTGRHTMHFVCGSVDLAWFTCVVAGYMMPNGATLILADGEGNYYHGLKSDIQMVQDIQWPGIGKVVAIRPYPDHVIIN